MVCSNNSVISKHIRLSGFGLDIVLHVEMSALYRFGLLSDEPVPHANTILEALAKHLEAKLSYGKILTSISFS